MSIPRVIGPGGASFINGDPLNSETSENMFKPKADDIGIRMSIVSGRVDTSAFGDPAPKKQRLIINADRLVIQEIPSTPENWAYFGCDLYKDGDKVTFNSPTPLYLSETEMGETYAEDFMTKAELGGGAYLERHDNEHYHYPLSEQSGGYYMVGKTYMKREGPEQYQIQVAAMKIPYGYGVVTRPWVWHGDGFLSGKWKFAYGPTTETLNLRLFKDNENAIPVHINTLGELEAAKADDEDKEDFKDQDQDGDDIYGEGDDSESENSDDIYNEGSDDDENNNNNNDYDENDMYAAYEAKDDSEYDEN